MKSYWEDEHGKIYNGHVLDVLKEMAPESVQMCVTSPPYWGLRSYLDDNHPDKSYEIGLEKTPEEFIEKLVQIFREVRRVLHPSGVCFVNMGDSYSGSGGEHKNDKGQSGLTNNRDKVGFVGPKSAPGLKPKDLCMMPARLAISLQADGWFLRSAMPWVKRSSMPESCRDRPASALEYVYMLTKNSRYFFDMEAIRVKTGTETSWENWAKADGRKAPAGDLKHGVNVGFGSKKDSFTHPSGRNYRNTDLFFESIKPPHGLISAGDELVGLDVNPQAMKESHFATFPEKLVEPLIKAGSSEYGCCPKCLAPYERVVETPQWYKELDGHKMPAGNLKQGVNAGFGAKKDSVTKPTKTIGWTPTCSCNAGEPIPCTILDIFFGSGTVAVVAERLGRKWCGIELSKDYIEIAKSRIEKAADPGSHKQAETERVTGQVNLFEGGK